MKTEPALLLLAERLKIVPRRLQHRRGTDYVGLDELHRAVDGTIHMGFRRQMHDDIRPEVGEDPVEPCPVADVELFEPQPRGVGNLRQRLQIPGIRKFIDHAHSIGGIPDDVPDHRRTDETGPAGHNDSSLLQNSRPFP